MVDQIGRGVADRSEKVEFVGRSDRLSEDALGHGP